MKRIYLSTVFLLLFIAGYAQTTEEKKPQLVAAEKTDSVSVQSNSTSADPASSAPSLNSQQAPKQGSSTGTAPQLSESGPRREE